MLKSEGINLEKAGKAGMKIAYLGIDLLKPVLDALLNEGCRVLKLFTCPVDNVTEFNTAVIRTAERVGIPYTLDRITAAGLRSLEEREREWDTYARAETAILSAWRNWPPRAVSCWCARGTTTWSLSPAPSPW